MHVRGAAEPRLRDRLVGLVSDPHSSHAAPDLTDAPASIDY